MTSDNINKNARDIEYMNLALKYAACAYSINETPVGCIIVHGRDKIVGYGYNRRETLKNPLCHAEISAINMASQNLGGWRLVECELYVTLEPCIMCTGAIINSRIKRVVFGAYDLKSGCFGSKMNINDFDFNHIIDYQGGVCEVECSNILTDFFKKLRNKKK